jgi:hypothetical protein
MNVPIREAIIVAEPGDPLRPIARVPLLVRTILTLQREGIERCTLVGALPRPADRRIRCTLASAPALAAPADDALRLVVAAPPSSIALSCASSRRACDPARCSSSSATGPVCASRRAGS